MLDTHFIPNNSDLVDKLNRLKTTIIVISRIRVNPLTVKLFNLNFHSLEVVFRWRDPQLQVSENYSDVQKVVLNVLIKIKTRIYAAPAVKGLKQFPYIQQTQNTCIAFVQCWPNDVGPALYKCYTNVLCLLGCGSIHINDVMGDYMWHGIKPQSHIHDAQPTPCVTKIRAVRRCASMNFVRIGL